MHIRRLALAVAASLSIIGAAHASPVTWNFNATLGGGLDYGLQAAGSFVYDADTGAYSNIFLTTPDGSIPGSTYNGTFGSIASGSVIDFISSTGQSRIVFSWNAPMTDAGGFLNANAASEWICADPSCTFESFQEGVSRGFNVATLASSEVPAPGTLPLALAALAGVAAIIKRRKLA